MRAKGIHLCAVASWGRTEVVRLLLEYGADPNLTERPKDGAMAAPCWARRKGDSGTAQGFSKHAPMRLTTEDAMFRRRRSPDGAH